MTPAARQKVIEALAQIQEAQYRIMDACAAISPVVGLVKEWERLGKLHDRVKAEWHRLDGLDGPFRLDSEPKSGEGRE